VKARERLRAGDPTGAVVLLEQYWPPHPLVTAGLTSLRADIENIERRRREAEERERRRREEDARRADERRLEEARVKAAEEAARENARAAAEATAALQTIRLQPIEVPPQTGDTTRIAVPSVSEDVDRGERAEGAVESRGGDRQAIGRALLRDWRMQVAAAVAIVGLAGSAAWVYSRQAAGSSTAPSHASAGGAAPVQNNGDPAASAAMAVVIDIAPWARIEAITRRADGRVVSGSDVVTPAVIMLPPGDYHLRASNPAFATLDMDFTVQPGVEQRLRVVMPEFDPEKEAAALADR
jgi:hypothetical protein